MMLAGKGIIKRTISQALPEPGGGRRHHGSPHPARQTSRDDMVFPSAGISFPSRAIRFGLRRSQGSSSLGRPNERKAFVLQSTAGDVAGLRRTFSAPSDEWHASCVKANSNHVPLGHWYGAARVKRAAALRAKPLAYACGIDTEAINNITPRQFASADRNGRKEET
jgi:hypothetical protein